MRPFQWVKNIILFLPMFFAQEIGDTDRLWNVAILFAGFCLLTSGVYIFNDLMDAGEDRLHPVKRFRPIASRKVSPMAALVFMFLLYATSALCFSFMYTSNNQIWLLLVYMKLKHNALVAYSRNMKTRAAIGETFREAIGRNRLTGCKRSSPASIKSLKIYTPLVSKQKPANRIATFHSLSVSPISCAKNMGRNKMMFFTHWKGRIRRNNALTLPVDCISFILKRQK